MYYAEHSYYRMYSHVAMYCAGAFIAYLVHNQPNMKISKVNISPWIKYNFKNRAVWTSILKCYDEGYTFSNIHLKLISIVILFFFSKSELNVKFFIPCAYSVTNTFFHGGIKGKNVDILVYNGDIL